MNLLAIALVPFEVGTGFLIPLSLPIIALANLALPKILYRGTALSWSRYAPAAIWLLLTVVAATPRDTGDLLMPSNSYSAVISLLYLALGAATAVMGVVLAKTDLRSFRRRRQVDPADNGARL